MKAIKILALVSLAVFSLSSMAMAADKNKYYCTHKVKGYKEGHFVVMDGDEVNMRQTPENGRVIKILGRHSLLQVLDSQNGWYKVQNDGVVGYVYAPFTGECKEDMLTEEDLALGYTSLGKIFDAKNTDVQLGNLRRTVKKDGRIYYEYDLGTIGVHKKKHLVEYIEVKDPQVITMRGLSVGDDSDRVVGQYGTPTTIVYGEDKNIYEYYFEDQHEDEYYFAANVDKTGAVTSWIVKKIE